MAANKTKIAVLVLAQGQELQPYEIGSESSIQDIATLVGISSPYKYAAMVDGVSIGKNDWGKPNLLKEDSIICFGTGGRGAVPTPNLKKVIKYLKASGYEQCGGKGDHKKFCAPSGGAVVLNPNNTDKKCLDYNSTKSLAKHLGFNLYELQQKFS